MAEMIMLPVGDLWQHPDNPRKNLGELQELADSIRENGIFQNLTVVPGHTRTQEEWIQICKAEGVSRHQALGTYEPDHLEDGYTVIIGHRRLAAAKLAGLTEVPCVVTEMTQREQLSTMLLENMQRSNLTSMEEAEGFQLMLDMGETVAGISTQTGISETTVRRRLNIAKLDKKDYEKGLQRGATLQDYLRLEKIHDIGQRNKVLKSIGTNNFEMELRHAVEAEKNKEYMQKLVAQFRNADWCKEIQRNSETYQKYSYVCNYGTYNKKPVEIPEDAGKVKYYFAVGQTQVDLYRDKSNKAPQKSAREIRLEGMQQHMSDIISKLVDQCSLMRDMRQDFIIHFVRCERYREEIISMAVQAMAEWMPHSCGMYTAPVRVNMKEIAKLLDIKYNDTTGTMEREQLLPLIRATPERILLLMAYFSWEAGVDTPWSVGWNGKIRCQTVKYQPRPELSRLYGILQDMEYEASDEEMAMIAGSTPWFREAEELEKAMEALQDGKE